MNMTDSARQVLDAISDVLRLADAYSTVTGKVEVERLYSAGTDLTTLLTALNSAGTFEVAPPVQQLDVFFDVRPYGNWLLAATNHYIRLRQERAETGSFIRAEIKKAYPGPDWNPNARPARDCRLTENELCTWRDILGAFGLQPEREYVKWRVSCTSIEKFDGLAIELEIDHFTKDICNGALVGRAFVSSSIEVAGTDHERAELALRKFVTVLDSLGIPLVACAGCYEDYFYRKIPLPAAQ
jgi:hypothetical protein